MLWLHALISRGLLIYGMPCHDICVCGVEQKCGEQRIEFYLDCTRTLTGVEMWRKLIDNSQHESCKRRQNRKFGIEFNGNLFEIHGMNWKTFERIIVKIEQK